MMSIILNMYPKIEYPFYGKFGHSEKAFTLKRSEAIEVLHTSWLNRS